MSSNGTPAVKNPRVMVTGGAGYVGSLLVPKLLAAGHHVTVLDLYLYEPEVFAPYRDTGRLIEIKGDLRDLPTVRRAVAGADAVIHLACISNDPSFDLDPDLGRSINYDCFRPLVRAAKDAGVKRFIYASSSSVYGIKDEQDVTEELALMPLTDYSKYKAMCEDILHEERAPGFVTLTLRPATVCGYAPRLRLDLSVNILTNHAVNLGRIKVFGGSQRRPNIHVEDMTDLYVASLGYDDAAIDGGVYNAGYENLSIMSIANVVRDVASPSADIDVVSTNDLRSYHISSAKLTRELGFTPVHSIADAVRGLKDAFVAGKIEDGLNNPKYSNIKLMQRIQLK